ncbi:Chaperone_protein DnaJ subfamily A [Hexamita inflata]|uniref:Chaperone protein DnaJ subfamily A n=1 Tax=Hexamita inflata TaxID=28002 RepID=A0AA86P934_9EUKA|nr:Chaperone protein DnaJ subfamily A [Hexamita inflata]
MPQNTKTVLFDILGVEIDADDKALRKAFIRLARQFNPNNPENSEKFNEICNAYHVLRDQYKHEQQQAQCSIDQQQEENNLYSIYKDVYITKEQMNDGADIDVEIQRSIKCPSCKGAGGAQNYFGTCDMCNGNNGLCLKCRGMGKAVIEPDKICKHCNGERTIKERKVFQVYIKPGTPDKHKTTLQGEGNQKLDKFNGKLYYSNCIITFNRMYTFKERQKERISKFDKAYDITRTIIVPKELMIKGGYYQTEIKCQIQCDECNGIGGPSSCNVAKCYRCGGEGIETYCNCNPLLSIIQPEYRDGYQEDPKMQFCSICGGKGDIIIDREKCCSKCNCSGVLYQKKILKVTIKPETPHKSRFTLYNQGHWVLDMIPGDVVLIVQSKEDNKFELQQETERLTETLWKQK